MFHYSIVRIILIDLVTEHLMELHVVLRSITTQDLYRVMFRFYLELFMCNANPLGMGHVLSSLEFQRL